MLDSSNAPGVHVDGRWTHREVSANGIRQHVAESGHGPLVLLLHGFPEFWYAWRHQLVALADAGLRAVAVDLRGTGGSDKPPRGYDPFTLSGDIAGLVRALGERDADIVGHDWGGALAWTTAALHPRVVRRVVVLGAPHPRRLRTALAADPSGQLKASGHMFTFQVPRYPEALLTRDDAFEVDRLLRVWSGPEWPSTSDFATASAAYRAAIQAPAAAHLACEYFRWTMRSMLRPDGWRYARLLSTPVTAPTLQLHGAVDSCVLPSTAQGSGRYAAAEYEWHPLADVGHFPHEEAPEVVSAEIIRWVTR